MRERREQIERLSRRRCIHLSFEGADEAFPFSFRHRRFALRHQFRAGSKVGVPHIEPIVARITFLPDATRRIPHRADPSPFFWMTRFTQAHDPQCHDAPIAVRPAEGHLSVCRPTGRMTINPPFEERAKAETARSISAASLMLTGLTSTPTDGATDWIATNWPIPAVIVGPEGQPLASR